MSADEFAMADAARVEAYGVLRLILGTEVTVIRGADLEQWAMRCMAAAHGCLMAVAQDAER